MLHLVTDIITLFGFCFVDVGSLHWEIEIKYKQNCVTDQLMKLNFVIFISTDDTSSKEVSRVGLYLILYLNICVKRSFTVSLILDVLFLSTFYPQSPMTNELIFRNRYCPSINQQKCPH